MLSKPDTNRLASLNLVIFAQKVSEKSGVFLIPDGLVRLFFDRFFVTESK